MSIKLNPTHLRHFRPINTISIGRGVTVALKVDFNVTIKDGKIQNPEKIRAAFRTIDHLLASGANIVIYTHLGQPKKGCEAKTSLNLVADFLAEKYGRDTVINGESLITPDENGFLPTEQYINKAVREAAVGLGGKARILLMPNVRWAAYEQAKPTDPGHQALAQAMLGLSDGFAVFDAAAVWNKEHASFTTMLRLAGLNNIAWGFHAHEMAELLVRRFTGDIPRPYVLHISGTKADKMGYILDFLGNPQIDSILVSGNIANGLMEVLGRSVGAAAGTYGAPELEKARRIVNHPRFGGAVSLPVDFIIARPDGSDRRDLAQGEIIPEGFRQFDIGRETASLYAKILATAGLAVNSGVPGAFDFGNPPFEEGTKVVLPGFARAKQSINLGGDGGIAAEKYLAPEELALTEVLVAGGSFLHAMAHQTFPVAEVFLN